MKEWILRHVFGDDIFISYSRADGASYAAALANALVDRNLSCRFDQWGTPPGREIPEELLRPLRRSAMLVVVGTVAAGQSLHVEREIREFLETKRLIVPIDVDGTVRCCARWWPLLDGMAVSSSGTTPSKEVVDRVVNSINFTTKNRKLQRLFAAATITLLVATGAAVLATRRATEQTAVAAEAEKSAAESAKEADKQAEISQIRRLANKSLLILGQRSDSLSESIDLAIEAGRRAEKLQVRDFAADRAIRTSLDLLPRVNRRRTLSGKATLSANGDYALTEVSPGMFKLVQTSDGKELFSTTWKGWAPVVSGDGKRIAVTLRTKHETVRVSDLETGRHWDILITTGPSYNFEMALSHNGKYLAGGVCDESSQGHEYTVSIWEVESGRKIPIRSISPVVQISEMAFGTTGNWFAITGQDDYATGQTVVFSFPTWKPVTADALTSIAQLSHKEVASLVGIGKAGELALYLESGATSIWAMQSNAYVEVVRLPPSKATTQLVFDSDEALSTVAATKTSTIVTSRTVTDNSSARPREKVTLLPTLRTNPNRRTKRLPGRGYVATLDQENTLTIADANAGRDITPKEIRGMHDVDDFLISADGATLAIVQQSGDPVLDPEPPFRLMLWDPVRGRKAREIAFPAWINQCAMSGDGSFIVAGDRNGTIQILDLRNKSLRTLNQYASVTSIAFNKDASLMAAADMSNTIMVYETREFEPIAQLKGTPQNIAFSDDDRFIGSERNGVSFLNMTDLLAELRSRVKQVGR